MEKKSRAQMEPLILEEVKFFKEEHDFSNWEFINTSDIDKEDDDSDEYGDDISFSECEDSLSNGFGSWLSWPSSKDDQENGDQNEKHDHDDGNEEESEEVEDSEEKSESNESDTSKQESKEDKEFEEKSESNESDSSEQESEEDELDLDDDLVPWSVYDQFERQRMRKLGKRGHAKMNKAKRLAYMYTRPGCVHGKHGSGLKHGR